MECIYYLNQDCIQCLETENYKICLEIWLTSKYIFSKIYDVQKLADVTKYERISIFKNLTNLSFSDTLKYSENYNIIIYIREYMINHFICPSLKYLKITHEDLLHFQEMMYLTNLIKLNTKHCFIPINIVNNFSRLTYLKFKISGMTDKIQEFKYLTNLNTLSYYGYDSIICNIENHGNYIYLQNLQITVHTLNATNMEINFPCLTTLKLIEYGISQQITVVNLKIQTSLVKLTVRYLRIFESTKYLKTVPNLRKLFLTERKGIQKISINGMYNSKLSFLKLENYQLVQLYGLNNLQTNVTSGVKKIETYKN